MLEATNATNRTLNFGLPLFVSGDKPTWLVDWNGTMEQLDVVMQNVKDTAISADGKVSNVTAQVELMRNLVDNVKNEVEIAVAEVSVATEDIKDLKEETANISSELNQDVAELHTAIDTLSTNVNESISTIQLHVAEIFVKVNTLETKVTNLESWAATTGSRIADAELDIDGLEQNMELKNQQIAALDTRVTRLENTAGNQEWDDRENPDPVSEAIGTVKTSAGTKNLYRTSLRIICNALPTSQSQSGNAYMWAGSASLGSGCKIVGLLPSHVDVDVNGTVYSHAPNMYVSDPAGINLITEFGNGSDAISFRIIYPTNSSYVGKKLVGYFNVLYYDVNE